MSSRTQDPHTQFIPLNKPKKSPRNVRQTPHGKAHIEGWPIAYRLTDKSRISLWKRKSAKMAVRPDGTVTSVRAAASRNYCA